MKLQLPKETQKLEIRILELQLQLASLHWQVSSAHLSALDSPVKYLGDLKAPQRTLFLQPWPHIFIFSPQVSLGCNYLSLVELLKYSTCADFKLLQFIMYNSA